MSSGQLLNLSVPRRTTTPPRDLTTEEVASLMRIADLLVPGNDVDPAPSAIDGYPQALHVALAARADEFETIVRFAAAAQDRSDAELLDELRAAHEDKAPGFQVLSTVLAGAYLLLPQIRDNIGYPGQRRDVPRIDEAAEQISDGILDPVIERGSIYVVVEPTR
ncbi:MAG TPA: hypothetical protein VGE11_04190 [Pseudonocardia sp.]